MIWLQVFTPSDDWAATLSADWCYMREMSRHVGANQNRRTT